MLFNGSNGHNELMRQWKSDLEGVDSLGHPSCMMICSRALDVVLIASLPSTSPPRIILASSKLLVLGIRWLLSGSKQEKRSDTSAL